MESGDNEALKRKITELEEQVEAQKRQLRIFENIVSEMPGHIYWKNENSIYLGCNAYAAKMAGLKDPKEITALPKSPWFYAKSALRC